MLQLTAHTCTQTHSSPLLSCLLLFSRFLGTLYAAEAAIHLGRLQEAVQYLIPDQITDISMAPPPVVGGAPDPSGGDNTSCDSKVNCETQILCH